MVSRFPFPSTFDGWYQVAYSDELPAGGVVPLHYFGAALVLYRDEGGVARVLDAHCPHLGAHLGFGGCVQGETLRCPFHGWRFDVNGACVEAPNASKIPPRAALRAWPVRETAGLILVHYARDGGAPTWEVSDLPEHGTAVWSRLRKQRWSIRSHAQEIGENFVDRAHFVAVHGMLTMPQTTVETEGHVLHSSSKTAVRTGRGEIPSTVEARAQGIGLWTLRMRSIVELVMISALTPVDDERVDARLGFTVRTADGVSTGHGAGAAMIDEVLRQVEQDIVIWENKVYRTAPLLADCDAPVAALRKWARQFHGEGR